MKKTFAYMATGILLGIAIMLIPNFFMGLGRFPLVGEDAARTRTQDLAPETEKTFGAVGITTFPSSLTYVGLMFVVSLISALGVYFFFKRRMPT